MSRIARAWARLAAYALFTAVLFAEPSGTKVRHDQIEFGVQTPNQVLASPNGSGGAAAFRPMVADDIPTLAQSKIANLIADLAAKYGIGANASLSAVTVTPGNDSPSGVFRRFAAGQMSPILGVQTENNTWIGYFDALGRVNFPGQTDGCATWSGGVLSSTGSECGTGGGSGGGAGAGGSLNSVQVRGPGGVSTGYEEITIDPVTKQLSVPSLKITGTGVGVMRLASGAEPAGINGASTIFSETGELLSFKAGTATKKQIVMMGGHLSGNQNDPNVTDFALADDGSLGAKALTFSRPNKTTTGTTLNRLAQLDASDNGAAVLATTADIADVYCVTGGAGITGSAELAEGGTASCEVDSAGSVGQWLVNSRTSNGLMTPTSTPASGEWIIGKLLTAPDGSGALATFKVMGFRWPAAAAGSDSALKTTTFQPVSTISNDGSAGTNGCPGACTETAFTQTYTIPAGSLVAGKRYRITFFGNTTSSTSSNPTYTIRLKAATSAAFMTSGVTLVTIAGVAMTAGCTNCGGGATVIVTATAPAGSSSSVYSNPVGNSLVATTGSTGRNTTAQPVNLATNADLVLGVTITWSTGSAAASFTLQDFIVEALN